VSFYQLAKVDLGGVSTATITNINQNMNHLVLNISARTPAAANSGYVRIRFNSDSGSNYFYMVRTAFKNQTTGYVTGINLTNSYFELFIPAANALASVYSHTQIDIFDYADTSRYTSYNCESGYDDNTASGGTAQFLAGIWKSTGAVTSITIFENSGSNFTTGSTAWLSAYGGA
jgi:hypothetical protein